MDDHEKHILYILLIFPLYLIIKRQRTSTFVNRVAGIRGIPTKKVDRNWEINHHDVDLLIISIPLAIMNSPLVRLGVQYQVDEKLSK